MGIDGCEGFDVYQGKDDPDQFVMMETWRSEQVHEAHFEKNARGSGWLEQVEALMTQPFEPLHASRFTGSNPGPRCSANPLHDAGGEIPVDRLRARS